jgi:3-hydroxyisobutyrate dehydrogenase-like beta-hydroxyacid dehydrogenase
MKGKQVGDGVREVGMVGLGLMGTAMSRRLLQAGFQVHGYDVDEHARSAHLDRGGTVGGSAADVAARCRRLILSLPNGAVMSEACLGPDGVREGAVPGSVVIDTTTSRPDEAIAVGEALQADEVVYCDVGISGNSAVVARGEALGVVGGPDDCLPAVAEVLAPFCRTVMRAGETGTGMRAKLVINHVLTLNRFALAEGLVHAEKVGMDLATTLEILCESAAYSRAMDMWGERMASGDYLPPASRVRNGNKDLQLILSVGKEAGAPMLALGQVDHVVQAMLANGLGDADNAVLAEMLRRLGGIGRLSAPPEDADD